MSFRQSARGSRWGKNGKLAGVRVSFLGNRSELPKNLSKIRVVFKKLTHTQLAAFGGFFEKNMLHY
jgi:hypothetical protein